MNLSESLAQYSVKSFTSFLTEEMGMSAAGTMSGAEKPAGGVGAGREVTDTSDQGADFQMSFPCIADGNCDADDLNRYLQNWQESDQGRGLADILGNWGGGAGGAAGTPIDGGADAAGPAVGGGGARERLRKLGVGTRG